MYFFSIHSDNFGRSFNFKIYLSIYFLRQFGRNLSNLVKVTVAVLVHIVEQICQRVRAH